MRRTELYVNPIDRNLSSRQAEVSLRGKAVVVPAYAARIDSELDLQALTQPGVAYNPGILAFSFPFGAKILTRPRARSDQVDLSLRPVKDPVAEILTRAIILTDPGTEWFYYGGSEENLNRSSLISSTALPDRIAEILAVATTANHAKTWVRLHNEKLLLALTDAYYTAQVSMGTDFALPPSPMITLENLEILLDILVKVNVRIRIATAEAELYPAFYAPLHYSLLRKRKALDAVLETIETAALTQRLLIFKLLWFANLEQVDERRNLAYFLNRIDKLKQSLSDRLCVLSLESGTEGHVMMFNGVDAYVEPLSGRAGPPKRATTHSNRTLYGSYLDSRTRQMVAWDGLREKVSENGGYLPDDCGVCERLHGRLLHESFDSLPWNILRRAHHFNVRMRDVEEGLKSAIASKSVREELLRYLSSGEKNLTDLAPPDWSD